jgi:rhodanese-related sulfurtransferase
MKVLKKSAIFAMVVPALTAFLSMSVRADECTYESQYGVLNPHCGYASEVSPAEAFLNTVVKQYANPSARPVLIDVRSTTEYRMGHPQNAYNVPYPFIWRHCKGELLPDGACDSAGSTGQIPQTDADFLAYVSSIVPNKDTKIYTLCRTGHRSVLAAALLAADGYTNVHNIWEGYVGLYLLSPQAVLDGSGNYQYYDGTTTLITELKPADLNHDGQLTDEDKNGWRYHQQLPYDTRLLPNLIYQPYADYYSQD